MDDSPTIRSRPELLQPADLEAIDGMVADLVAQEHELSAGTFMLAVAAATVGITVSLIRRDSYAPEEAAGRALAVAELVVEGWVTQFRQRLVQNSW
jgi:hypothetical protein